MILVAASLSYTLNYSLKAAQPSVGLQSSARTTVSNVWRRDARVTQEVACEARSSVPHLPKVPFSAQLLSRTRLD